METSNEPTAVHHIVSDPLLSAVATFATLRERRRLHQHGFIDTELAEQIQIGIEHEANKIIAIVFGYSEIVEKGE